MKKDTGGPAFPAGMIKKSKPRHDPGADFEVTDIVSPKQEGMTLRDYFAAKAMPIAFDFVRRIDPNGYKCTDKGKSDSFNNTYDFDWQEGGIEMVAEFSYEMADAMIEERNK